MNWPGSCRLLGLSALRYAWRHPWQTWMNFTGIMLGVMMVVAVDLANNSASRAFELAVETVSGTISHQIVGGSEGVPDAVFTGLRTELGIRRSAPGISATVSADGREYTLVGLDPLSEISLRRQRPGVELSALGSDFILALSDDFGVLMSESAATAANLQRGDELLLYPGFELDPNETGVAVNLTGLIESGDPVATEGLIYADIALAQILLNRSGRLDSIDLILTEDEVQTISEWLPAGLSLVDAQSRNDSMQRMSNAFQINLLAMSLLSLLVAGLLIYNTVTLSVLQREHTLGVYRSQGVSRRQIFVLVMVESGLMGLAASLAGLLLGFYLGEVLVMMVAGTISDLNFRLNVTTFLVDPWSLATGMALGLGVSLLSAAIPAWRAMHAPPVTLQQRAVKDARWQGRLLVLSIVGGVMMLAGFLLTLTDRGGLIGGFVALTFIIFGFCFLVPAMMSLALSGLLALFGGRMKLSLRMALRNIRSAINRTGLAVAALTVAVSVTVGVGVMVESFRGTVIIWLDQSFSGDVEVALEGVPAVQQPALREALSAVEGVTAVSATVNRTIESELGQVRLNVGSQSAADGYFLREARDEGLADFSAGEGVLISEPLAVLDGLAIDDQIRLVTDQGIQAFRIIGTFYDYTPGIGMVGMAPSLYRQWWNDPSWTRFTVYADEGDDVLPGVRDVLTDYEGASAIPNQVISDVTLEIFDRTFAITGVLRLLAVLIAFVGVLSALMALLLERSREFASLRATGMTPGQIRTLVIGQTGLMGIFAGVFSLPLGLLMADVLIDVINRRSFGWTLQPFLPLPVLADALLLSLMAALVAGIYPAFKAASISPAQALREE